MRERPRRIAAPRIVPAILLAAALAGCTTGGAVPSPSATPEPSPTLDLAPTPSDATPSDATPSAPLESSAPPSASDPVEAAASPSTQPTAPVHAPATAAPAPTRAPRPAFAPSTLTVDLTAPIRLHATVPAQVTCEVGPAYHMDSDVEIDGNEVFVSVDIGAYHGPGPYRATVSLEVTAGPETRGGALPGVPVTIVSATSGTAQYAYSGAMGSVSGTVSWGCTTNG